MSELGFQYYPEKTFFHKLDARFKFIIVTVLSITTSFAESYELLFILSLLGLLILFAKLPIIRALKDLKFFYIFLLFIIISRALFSYEKPHVDILFISLSISGIKSGFIFSLKLVVIIFFSFIMIATSKISEITSAIDWFFSFLPFKFKNISTMIGLMIRFFPLIISEAKTIDYARRARCIQSRKFSIFKIKSFIISLMFKIFYTADNISASMEARAYSEKRTKASFKLRFSDWFSLFISFFICSIIYIC
jgi:energy-coupling factor transporter transmembrane protein EcfT